MEKRCLIQAMFFILLIICSFSYALNGEKTGICFIFIKLFMFIMQLLCPFMLLSIDILTIPACLLLLQSIQLMSTNGILKVPIHQV